MTPQGIAQLKTDEGCVLTSYPDPLSGDDPWTIGYGHTSSGIHQGMTVDQDQAEGWLASDIAKAESGLAGAISWLGTLADFRQDVLTNMAFNMGVQSVLNFHHMLAAMQVQDWASASAEMLDSKWATQVGQRANRLATVMEKGYGIGS